MTKVHKIIIFNQKAWLKPDMNTTRKKKGKNDFERYFCKLMNNVVLQKLWRLWENLEALHFYSEKKEKLFSIRIKPWYNKFFFSENSIAVEMCMNKSIYLGLSLLELNKIVWAFVWFHKTKKERKSKTMLYGYRQTHCIHKNKICL